MTPAKRLLVPSLAVALAGGAFAQGADECVNAIDLGVGSTAFPFDSSVCSDTGMPATNSPESACSLSADIWVKYTASASGMATFDTCNNATFDTEIGVYEGADCMTFVNLGCNDDASGCSGNTSSITVPVSAGETYYCQVGYWLSSGSTVGAGTLTITEMPFGGGADDCVNAIDLGVGSTTFDFDTNNCSDTGAPATNSPESACSLSNDVWVKFTASANGTATIDTCNNANYDTEIGVYEGADCATFVNLGCNDDSTGCSGFTSSITVPVIGGETYHVQVGYFSGSSSGFGMGTLTITEMPTTGPPPNDDCSMPDPASQGANAFDSTNATTSGFAGNGGCSGLSATINQDVFYVFTVPFDGTWAFDTFGTSFDTKLAVHDGMDCSATCLDYNDDTGGLQSEVVLGLMGGDTVLIQVGAFSGGMGPGTLNITATSTPCDVPDGFEENDDCAGAAPVVDGFYAGLNVEDTDQDYFAVTLADGATIDATIFFTDADGDLDLYLWDPTVGCDTNVAGTGGPYLDRGFSSTDDESVSYTNMTGSTQYLILEVDVFTSGTCNGYDLEVTGTGDGTVGTRYCAVEPNSTGAPASLSGSGSASLANNDLVLLTRDAPNGAFGFVLASLSRDFVPLVGGGSGNLCLGGDVGRGVGGQIYSTGATGGWDAPVDWTAVPQPTGPVAAIVGDTWFFQSWFRDFIPGAGPTSNLSNGLGVMVE